MTKRIDRLNQSFLYSKYHLNLSFINFYRIALINVQAYIIYLYQSNTLTFCILVVTAFGCPFTTVSLFLTTHQRHYWHCPIRPIAQAFDLSCMDNRLFAWKNTIYSHITAASHPPKKHVRVFPKTCTCFPKKTYMFF